MRIEERDKRALTVLGVFFVLLLVYFAVSPWLDDWGEARERIASARSQLQTMRQQVIRLKSDHARLSRALGGGVPGDPAQGGSGEGREAMGLSTVEEARLQSIQKAEGLLKQGGLKILDVQQQQVRAIRELSGISLVTFKVEGTGRFDQLPKCLAAIRKSEDLLLIQKLDVKSDARQQGKITLTLILGTLAWTEGGAS